MPNKRCRYVCTIHDVAGRPEFRVLVQEPSQDDLELRDVSPRAVWARILEPLAALRRQGGGVQLFPRFLSGEDLFGLTEPAVVRVLESLPGTLSILYVDIKKSYIDDILCLLLHFSKFSILFWRTSVSFN